jgi:hypothetical protein
MEGLDETVVEPMVTVAEVDTAAEVQIVEEKEHIAGLARERAAEACIGDTGKTTAAEKGRADSDGKKTMVMIALEK